MALSSVCSHQLSLKLWALPAPRTPGPQSSWSMFSADQGRPVVVNLGPHGRESRKHQWVFPGAQASLAPQDSTCRSPGGCRCPGCSRDLFNYRGLKCPVARGALGRPRWDLRAFPAASGRTDPGGPPPGREGMWGWQGGARRVEHVPSPVRLADSGYSPGPPLPPGRPWEEDVGGARPGSQVPSAATLPVARFHAWQNLRGLGAAGQERVPSPPAPRQAAQLEALPWKR